MTTRQSELLDQARRNLSTIIHAARPCERACGPCIVDAAKIVLDLLDELEKPYAPCERHQCPSNVMHSCVSLIPCAYKMEADKCADSCAINACLQEIAGSGRRSNADLLRRMP